MESGKLRSKRIFIIEDNAANLDIMLIYLRGAGAIPLFGHWDENTLEHLDNHLPLDAILLDLNFPDNLSGYDIFDQLRTLSFLDDVPIIAITALSMDEALPRAKKQGFSGYINKPVQRELLVNAVQDIINGKSVWGTINE